jgi:hypothetical protein
VSGNAPPKLTAMAEAPIPDADEADALEQAEPVEPHEDNAPEIRVRTIPLDASEADVIEQSIEVPFDDEDERP